jgi:hypothetical protein
MVAVLIGAEINQKLAMTLRKKKRQGALTFTFWPLVAFRSGL